MLSIVSPVMVGAEAASPQPTTPLSDSRRTSTLSACLISTPAMNTGFFIGKATAIGSMRVIFMLPTPFAKPPAHCARDVAEDEGKVLPFKSLNILGSFCQTSDAVEDDKNLAIEITRFSRFVLPNAPRRGVPPTRRACRGSRPGG